jgi:two-component system, chemotaxis family, protein-glutamate methylesterase/glutaminase
MKVPKTRVLIVDDSAIVRRVLTDMLSGQPDIEVIATAPDPYVARDKILELKPDVLTLDLEMPRMDGISFLRRLMHFHPLPVVVISSIAESGSEVALEALRLGAVDVLAKPGGPYSVEDLGERVVDSVRAAARVRVKSRREEEAPQHSPPVSFENLHFSSNALVGIGASTGGVEAIHDVLVQLPTNFPPILVVQHLPRAFSRSLVEQLNRTCALEVREAQETNELLPGRVLIAPGERHMEVRYAGTKRAAVLSCTPPVNRHRPSVDVLFRSMAKAGARNCVGVLLTGMGSDGAEGLLAMRQGGAATIAQDRQSSVVYGMPAEAARLGAAEVVLPLKDIAGGIVRAISRTVRA